MKKTSDVFVVYANDEEVLVGILANEAILLREWFTDTGRNKDEYERGLVSDSGVLITFTSSVRVRGMF